MPIKCTSCGQVYPVTRTILQTNEGIKCSCGGKLIETEERYAPKIIDWLFKKLRWE